jgi:hypothetical protein
MTQHIDPPIMDASSQHEELDHPKIYAARMRLQNSLDQADALEAIREIVANLLGSEELALFRLDPKHGALWLYWSFGLDPNKYVVLDAISDPTLSAALKGKIVTPGTEEKLQSIATPVSAVVPIVLDGATVAVLLIFRLFTHKKGLDATDRELLNVLSNCSGRAVGYKA